MMNFPKITQLLFHLNRLRPVELLLARCVHHHKELEQPGGFKRFIGLERSNKHKANRNTHVNERKYRRLRGKKRILVELEDADEQREVQKLPMEQIRMYFLRRGKPNPFANIDEPVNWKEHEVLYQSLSEIADMYLPPEQSLFARLRKEGPREVLVDAKEYIKDKMNSFRYGLRRIRKKEGFQNFDLKEFAKEAEKVYVSAYTALANREREKLRNFVTERAFNKLWPDVAGGTLHWELVRFNQPSVVTYARCFDMPLKSGNDIAQVTVRMHSTQKLALYDKDGHLLMGSEDEPKEVMEYIVFENHIASVHGRWRFHGRLNPQSQKPKQAILRPSIVAETSKDKPQEPVKLRSELDKNIKIAEKKQKEENGPPSK